jgi:putative transposase
MEKLEYIKDEHRVHLIIYHIIWCTKRRKQLLINEIKNDCEKLINEKCEEKGWKIISLSVQPEHIHLFVRVFPTTTVYDVVKECKGYAAYNLRKKYKTELSELPHH